MEFFWELSRIICILFWMVSSAKMQITSLFTLCRINLTILPSSWIPTPSDIAVTLLNMEQATLPLRHWSCLQIAKPRCHTDIGKISLFLSNFVSPLVYISPFGFWKLDRKRVDDFWYSSGSLLRYKPRIILGLRDKIFPLLKFVRQDTMSSQTGSFDNETLQPQLRCLE